jgi:hypothetical protein
MTSENTHSREAKPQLGTSENRTVPLVGGRGHVWEEDAFTGNASFHKMAFTDQADFRGVTFTGYVELDGARVASEHSGVRQVWRRTWPPDWRVEAGADGWQMLRLADDGAAEPEPAEETAD